MSTQPRSDIFTVWLLAQVDRKSLPNGKWIVDRFFFSSSEKPRGGFFQLDMINYGPNCEFKTLIEAEESLFCKWSQLLGQRYVMQLRRQCFHGATYEADRRGASSRIFAEAQIDARVREAVNEINERATFAGMYE